MNRRYKILLIAVFPFLLFFSVKSMNNSLSHSDSSENYYQKTLQISTQVNVQPANSTISVQLTHYSQP